MVQPGSTVTTELRVLSVRTERRDRRVRSARRATRVTTEHKVGREHRVSTGPTELRVRTEHPVSTVKMAPRAEERRVGKVARTGTTEPKVQKAATVRKERRDLAVRTGGTARRRRTARRGEKGARG